MSGFASEGVTLRRGSLRAPVTTGTWRLSLCGHGSLCPEGFSSRSRWWRSGASGVQGVPALGSPPVLFPGATGKARPAAGVCRHQGGGAVLPGGAATRRRGAEAPAPARPAPGARVSHHAGAGAERELAGAWPSPSLHVSALHLSYVRASCVYAGCFTSQAAPPSVCGVGLRAARLPPRAALLLARQSARR